MLKFRTLPVNAEMHGPVWSGPDAGRSTGLGRILRRYSLESCRS
jgi:Sugar transferases involved in lipopolysaccharide synthesis